MGCQLSSAASGTPLPLGLCLLTQFLWRETNVLDNLQLVVLPQSGGTEFGPHSVHDNLWVPFRLYAFSLCLYIKLNQQTCMYVCMNRCTHACMYACMYIHQCLLSFNHNVTGISTLSANRPSWLPDIGPTLSQQSLESVLQFNIKMTSYHYRKSHCENKTNLLPFYLSNGISYPGAGFAYCVAFFFNKDETSLLNAPVHTNSSICWLVIYLGISR